MRRDHTNGPAPDPSIIRPGGIRDRALRAVIARGRQYEDAERTKASRDYWRSLTEKEKAPPMAA